jgi:branched-chain amino acid transport system substrate-binding protein
MMKRVTKLSLLVSVMMGAAQSAALAQAPIKIGIVHPFSGPLALVGNDATDGFTHYFDLVQNRVAGRPVVLIKEDDAANPSQGLERTRRLVEREQVHILSGMTSSAVAYAIRGYVDQRQVPLVIMGSAGANDLTDKQASPYIFRTSFSNRQLGGAFGNYACTKLGYKKVTIMASDFVTGHEQSAAFEEQLKKAGCEVDRKIMVPLGTSDFTPFLSQLASSNANAVWAMFFAADAIAYIKQYDSLGLKGKIPLIGPSGLIDPAWLKATAKSGVGIEAPMYYLPSFASPENKAFVESFRAKYNRTPGATAVSGYVAAAAIAKAIEAIGGKVEDKPAFLAALKAVKIATPIGEFQFDEKQNVVLDFYRGRVVERDGAFELEMVEPMAKRVDQFGNSR